MYEIAFFLKLPFTCYGMGCKRMQFRKFAIKDFFGDFLGFFFYKRNIQVLMTICILLIAYDKSYTLNSGELI